jgi:hypothetical protein
MNIKKNIEKNIEFFTKTVQTPFGEIDAREGLFDSSFLVSLSIWLAFGLNDWHIAANFVVGFILLWVAYWLSKNTALFQFYAWYSKFFTERYWYFIFALVFFSILARIVAIEWALVNLLVFLWYLTFLPVKAFSLLMLDKIDFSEFEGWEHTKQPKPSEQHNP